MSLHRKSTVILATFMLLSCASVRMHEDVGTSMEVTPDTYAMYRDEMGIVLLDARWGRQWGCGGFENAQLISFSFDRFPISERSNEAQADLTVGTTRVLSVRPEFQSYALLVPPGKYALSNFRIRVAGSVASVGYWVAGRSDLIQDGSPVGGSFSVAAGEVVYIGNFALDCGDTPSLWRYHAKGREGFDRQLSDYQSKYPYLDLSETRFRLLETELIGYPYDLP